jgi:hypothetical protein
LPEVEIGGDFIKIQEDSWRKLLSLPLNIGRASEWIRTIDRWFTNTWLVFSPRFEAKTTQLWT